MDHEFLKEDRSSQGLATSTPGKWSRFWN